MPVWAFFAASDSRCRISSTSRQRRRHVELAVEAHSLRDLLEQVVDRRDADRGEHLVAVALGEREVPVGHCSATTARYASTSSRSFTSVGSVRRMRTSQPSPYGSSLIDSGSSDGLLVHLEDLARERCDHVGDGLDRLDLAVRLVLDGRASDRGCLEVHELAEGVLRPPGDPEHRLVALDPRPVVLGVVLQILRVALFPCHLAPPP